MQSSASSRQRIEQDDVARRKHYFHPSHRLRDLSRNSASKSSGARCLASQPRVSFDPLHSPWSAIQSTSALTARPRRSLAPLTPCVHFTLPLISARIPHERRENYCIGAATGTDYGPLCLATPCIFADWLYGESHGAENRARRLDRGSRLDSRSRRKNHAGHGRIPQMGRRSKAKLTFQTVSGSAITGGWQ